MKKEPATRALKNKWQAKGPRGYTQVCHSWPFAGQSNRIKTKWTRTAGGSCRFAVKPRHSRSWGAASNLSIQPQLKWTDVFFRLIHHSCDTYNTFDSGSTKQQRYPADVYWYWGFGSIDDTATGCMAAASQPFCRQPSVGKNLLELLLEWYRSNGPKRQTNWCFK